jgi:hypothetical protein
MESINRILSSASGDNRAEAIQSPKLAGEVDFRLGRWLVYFGSGSDWYPVGEFVATDAKSAIELAIEVLGCGSAYRAEEIPWDAAPLHQPSNRSRQLKQTDTEC